jgi:hypothetical protein
LAAFASFRAYVETFNLASNVVMQAWAMAKATVAKEKMSAAIRSMSTSKWNKNKQKKKVQQKTLGCISSLLNLDTFGAKRKKSLHQRLQSTNCVRILEFKNKQSRLHEAMLTWSEEEDGWWTSREIATAAAFLWHFRGSAPEFFFERTGDGSTTTVSSWECPLGVVKAAERGTTLASFFGLSSSLKGNYSTSRGQEESKTEILW